MNTLNAYAKKAVGAFQRQKQSKFHNALEILRRDQKREARENFLLTGQELLSEAVNQEHAAAVALPRK